MITDYALSLRPKSLDEMCGQKTIVAEMKKRSLTMEFPSVMIFGGDSGTGKTTMALILGALMNDPNPIKKEGYCDPNPDSAEYKAVYSEAYNRNVCFYDASKMGKEDVVALEDVVGTKSLFGGKKVVIIDEAQELSRHSKGATLKLLEKKRDDVCIILCTMNPEVFDKSIRSRGQYYQFRSPNSADIAAYLFSLTERVGADELPDSFIEKGIFTIAENCEGSVRMAVQTLERCLTAQLWTEEQIQQEFGYISSENLLNIVKTLLSRKAEAFKMIQDFDLKDFFYQSNKLISDCIVYHRTGICDADWKKAQYESLRSFTKELTELYSLYTDIDLKMGAYFKDSFCKVRLTDFLVANPSPAPAGRPSFAPVGSSGLKTR